MLDSVNAIRGVAVEYSLPVCMMVGLLEKEPGVPPRQSKRYGVRIVEPILEAMGIAYHEIEEAGGRGQDPARHRRRLCAEQARRAPDRTEAVMIDREHGLPEGASPAMSTMPTSCCRSIRPPSTGSTSARSPLNYLSHGAMGLASSHGARAWRSAGPTGA